MPPRLTQITASLVTSPAPTTPAPAGRRWLMVVGLVATVIGGWYFAFLLRRYLGLGTTYDLYLNLQLATTWLDGHFLYESFFGNYLSIHTYFLSPLLAVFAGPWGAPGLLFTGGLAAALGVIAMVRILRLLAVPIGPATVCAAILTLMPLSLQVYQVDLYGFQIELFVPALALWLSYFLLRRNWAGTIAVGLALQALKEDSVFILIPVAVVVGLEDCLRPRPAGSGPGRWNRPALTVVAFTLLVTPLLLLLIKSQMGAETARYGSFAKVHALDRSHVTDLGSLAVYGLKNSFTWLGSETVRRWLLAVFAGTAGLIVFRPHLLVVGVLTTVTAWLLQTNLYWAPRFAPTVAFIQLVACLGFASLWRTVTGGRPQPAWLRFTGVTLAGLGLAAALAGQYRLAPASREVYTMSPTLAISPPDRQRADAFFEKYRLASHPDEPVIASEYLYRYIEDRNFFWYMRLDNRPTPVWILWDKQDVSPSALWTILRAHGKGDVNHYRLFAEDGRFQIYRLKPAEEIAREMSSSGPPVTGASHGLVRMKVRIAAGRAGLSEPLLAIGPTGRGNLFFFRYLDDQHLVLGFENMGDAVYTSEPVEFVPDTTYDLELFAGSLLKPASDADTRDETLTRLAYRNLVIASFNGREVLHTLAPIPSSDRAAVFAGINPIKSESAGSRFLGEITGVARGGLPAVHRRELATNRYGPVKLTVQLPGAPAGVPEPLVVNGLPGKATLGYIRVLPDRNIGVGAEFWGVGAFDSKPVRVVDPSRVEVVYSFPSLYPPVDDPWWGTTPMATRVDLRSWLRVTVNRILVLEKKLPSLTARSATMTFGANPVGGSWVGPTFTGSILQVLREPLAATPLPGAGKSLRALAPTGP